MSIFLVGLTRCPLCRQIIETEETAVMFPAFAWDEADPLWVFNDATIHHECLRTHPSGALAEAVATECIARTGPGKRKCAVCGEEIRNPDDYILIPRLTDDVADPLYRFNYTHLHRSHIAGWKDYQVAMGLLRRLAMDKWKGRAMASLISELDSYSPSKA